MHANGFAATLLITTMLPALCVIGAEPAPPAHAPPAAVVTPPAFVKTVTLNGRVAIDAAAVDSDDAAFSDGTEVRRARIGARGEIDAGWPFRLDYELTDSESEGFRDAYVGYTGLATNTLVRVGQFMEYGSLEDTLSSKYVTFLERALPLLAFTPAERRIGTGLDRHGTCWYAGAGVFGENAGEDEREDDGVGGSTRTAVFPWRADGRLLHLATWAQYRQPRGDERQQFAARPETHVDDTRLVSTGPISNVTATTLAGLEAAAVWGSASLQAEYVGAAVDRDGFATEHFGGWYAYASWFFTGETRAYDPATAVFTRVRPSHPVGQGGAGAWEGALRYSTLDLNDHRRGGEEDNWTVALNWYPTASVRFMLNYIMARAERDDGAVDADIVALRSQVEF